MPLAIKAQNVVVPLEANHTVSGLITKSYGRTFVVEIDGAPHTAHTKNKTVQCVVGDYVDAVRTNPNEVQITHLHSRRNLVYRATNNKSKLIASNVDQLLIVIAIKPNFNINFLNHCLLFAESANITPIIVINKTDLPESEAFIHKITALYRDNLHYKTITVSAITSIPIELSVIFLHNTSLLIGQSGMGKSTLLNSIIPGSNARTGDISKTETHGCHTTTHSVLYHIDAVSHVIDCPGLQEFGLYHLHKDNLLAYYPEFREYIGNCRFRNCQHLEEPGCVITQLYEANKINKERYFLLRSLQTQIKN